MDGALVAAPATLTTAGPVELAVLLLGIDTETAYEEGPYVNDEKHGHWVERTYPDGRRVDEGPCVNGQEHGLWIIRYSDGTVLESHYVNGELKVN